MFIGLTDLEVLPQPDLWALRAPLRWSSPDLEVTIPAGFITDLASIPRLLRSFFDVDGRSRSPAVLHDWLYARQTHPRAFCDEKLREALELAGESAFTARTYWLGVHIGGWVAWRKHARAGGVAVQNFVSLGYYQAWLDSLGDPAA